MNHDNEGNDYDSDETGTIGWAKVQDMVSCL